MAHRALETGRCRKERVRNTGQEGERERKRKRERAELIS
jgi:hypothetical protein